MEYQNWIAEFAAKRRAQRTNCFLAQTFDKEKRLEQFIDLVKNGGLAKLLGAKESKPYQQLVGFNLQKNRLYNLKTGANLPLDSMTSPLTEIGNFLEGTKTICVIDYIFTKEHADALVDWLAAWSQDGTLYANKSTVLVFIADETLFPETLRRLCYTLEIIPSTEDERTALLQKLVNELQEGLKAKYGDNIPEDVDLTIGPEHIQASGGLELRPVETAALESFYESRSFKVQTFTEAKIKILATYGLTYVQPQYNFSHIGGYKLLKDYIQKRVIYPLKNPDKAKYYATGMPRGVILYGYYGCGKSFFGTTIATELGLPMIKLGGNDFFRGIVGESEKQVKRVTQLIESAAPVVVLFEEVDGLAPARDKVLMTDSGVSRRIENGLLDWLGDKNRKSFIIGTTNFIEHMDKAFIRSGRIDEIVLILPPDRDARKEILNVHCNIIRKIPIKEKEFTEIQRFVSEDTFMWTGAELEKLCLDASRTAMDVDAKHVTLQHFQEAKRNFDVNVNKRKETVQGMYNSILKLENVSKGFIEQTKAAFEQGEGDKGRMTGFFENL